MSQRRKSREIAVQALYQYWIRPDETAAIASLDWLEREQPPAITDFARELFLGAAEAIDESDALVAAKLTGWEPDRLGGVERAILRLAVYEIAKRDDIPAEVTIAEAVHLAQVFCDEKAYQIVNGVLDGIFRSLVPAAHAAGTGGGADQPPPA